MADALDWRKSLLALFEEIYAGPPNPRGTWIVENEADSGVFGSLDRLGAEEASAPPLAGRNTVAAHANHLLYSLQFANAWMRGERPKSMWEESWHRQHVTEEEWATLRQNLKAEFAVTVSHLRSTPVADEETLTGCLALAAHAAYHLGAVRQLSVANP